MVDGKQESGWEQLHVHVGVSGLLQLSMGFYSAIRIGTLVLPNIEGIYSSKGEEASVG